MKLPNGYGSVVKLSGKRRNPYIVKVPKKYVDSETQELCYKYETIAYKSTKKEALDFLKNYHSKGVFDPSMIFSDVYSQWSEQKFPFVSESNVKNYRNCYTICESLHEQVFADIKLKDLEKVIEDSDKNYPTIRKIKVFLNQMYGFALLNEVCSRDYSSYLDISKYQNRNVNSLQREIFTIDEINLLWEKQGNRYYQMILILIYTGVRVTELLNVKKSDVDLEQQTFNIVKSKNNNGVRLVPIADKILPLFIQWYKRDSTCEYLFHTIDFQGFKYRNYYDSYYTPLLLDIKINRSPHCARHTFITMMKEAGADSTITKKIVGHVSVMTLTERVYTHPEIKQMLNEVNKI